MLQDILYKQLNRIKNNTRPMTSPPVPTESIQFNLFTRFLGDETDLSNTIEFWDSIPKYALSPRVQDKMRSAEGHLEVYTRTFEHQPMPKSQHAKRTYQLTMRPARIRTEQGWLEYYPSADEELVEEVIRKIHTDQTLGMHDPGKQESWVRFSISMIRRELAKRGKTRSLTEIKRSIEILANTKIEIRAADDKATKTLRFTPLADLMSVERSDYLADPDAKWCARLPALYSVSINNITYRQYNYAVSMQLSSPLARYLFKQLNEQYVNAHVTVPYTLRFTDIEQTGMLGHSRRARNIQTLETILNEFMDKKILLDWKGSRITSGRKIIEVEYVLIAHMDFVADIKAANKRKSEAEATYFAAGLPGPARERHITRTKRKAAHGQKLAAQHANDAMRQRSIASANAWADHVDSDLPSE